MPDPGVESLKRILLQEAKLGFKDTTVFGGLDAFLSRLDSSSLHPLPGSSYRQLTPEARREWARIVLDGNGQAPPPSLPSKNSPAAKTKGTTVAKATASARSARPSSPARRPVVAGAVGKPGPRAARGVTPESPVRYLKGVGEYWEKRLEKMGVKVVQDLISLLPHRHIDYRNVVPISRLAPGREQTVIGTVWESSEATLGRRMKGTETIIGDESGNVRAVWFNQPHLWRSLPSGSRVALSGKPTLFKNRPVFESPDYEVLDNEADDFTHTGRLVPVYPLTEGLKPRAMRTIVKTALDVCVPRLKESLPPDLLTRLRLPSLQTALIQAHYPDDMEQWQTARRRLAFEELLYIQLGVLVRRKRRREEQGERLAIRQESVDGFLSSLPFTLTPAQSKVLTEILDDLSSGSPMARLLQGDVGSGKTVVAAAAATAVVAAGYQAVVMAPTEILAEQHFKSLTSLWGGAGQLAVRPVTKGDSPWRELVEGHSAQGKLGSPRADYLAALFPPYLDSPLKLGLLTGSLTPKEKEGLKEHIARGAVDIVMGTHALIQEDVAFQRLGFVVIDEQHRFGVDQRWSLRQRGENPHLLVMSATPIPRTLALTLYGDLDVSTIDQLPPGRAPIETKWLPPSRRREAYSFIREQVGQGRQAFIICPLVEESPVVEARAATEEYRRLSAETFPDLRLGLLHGRMSATDKDAVMAQLKAGALDILVSTAVVEVGIDIPNATVMLIEGAERFGLAQLHQFRGRVGRGQHKSYCMLLSDSSSPDVKARLSVIEKTQDGFLLAEEDLKLRGPGDLLGTRQSGLPELKFANLADVELLQLARQEAANLLEHDPDLAQPDHAGLLAQLQALRLPEADVS